MVTQTLSTTSHPAFRCNSLYIDNGGAEAGLPHLNSTYLRSGETGVY